MSTEDESRQLREVDFIREVMLSSEVGFSWHKEINKYIYIYTHLYTEFI